MLEFLVSLLLLLLSLNSHASQGLEKAVNAIEENVPSLESTPNVENPLENRLSNAPNESNPEDVENGVPQENGGNQVSQNNNSDNATSPDTNKSEAFNTQSQNVIGSVANVAIEESPVLEPYTNEGGESTSTPTPTPTPIEEVEPTDPPVTRPHPPICKDVGIVCPQVYCLNEITVAFDCSCECDPHIL